MAEPANFKEANFTWKGWPAKGDEPEVLDLPSWKGGDLTISCWRMSWAERLAVLFTGRAWLGVYGRQPPVWVSGRNPLVPAQNDPHTEDSDVEAPAHQSQ